MEAKQKKSTPSVDPVLIEKLTLMCLNYHIKRDERPVKIRRRKKPPCLMWDNNHPKSPHCYQNFVIKIVIPILAVDSRKMEEWKSNSAAGIRLLFDLGVRGVGGVGQIF
ncbi:hypothetical protein CEXT_714811 [Caerostris extrusa]|uniref:Uncharacterized protein n=1 Tax=Caerostris extrusa TaxID=172846 RepID=A0AAV4XQT2_CAEEX|nr:hypothetical protein CEXT_714811 [Caerostris extrusa]